MTFPLKAINSVYQDVMCGPLQSIDGRIKMLLAAIVQITYWVIGVIAHGQYKQKYFQMNTVNDRKVFSYFTLGRLMIRHQQLSSLTPDPRTLQDIIKQELNRVWWIRGDTSVRDSANALPQLKRQEEIALT
jgi:hypothetical protein